MPTAKPKKMTSQSANAEAKPEDLLPWFERYLEEGNGRGRLQSKPLVFEGKAGYFCISRALKVDGVEQEVILFCCMPHDDVLVTRLPLYPGLTDSVPAAKRKRPSK
jgi:hypothetical protein